MSSPILAKKNIITMNNTSIKMLIAKEKLPPMKSVHIPEMGSPLTQIDVVLANDRHHKR